MSRETLSRVLDEAASLGVMKLGLTGGEPTLYPDLEGVIREAKHLGFWVSLKTHGVLSSRRLHALWEAGLNRIVVSLHGLAKVHDSFTGVSKSFEKTMAIVEDALALGIQVEVSITVTAVNRNEIVPLIAALEHLELDINVSHVVSDRHDGVEIPIRLKLSHDEWMDYFNSLPDHLRPETVDSLSFKCGCATSNFAITHTGQVQPCISVPWCAGSVHEQSLQEIWVNSPVFQERFEAMVVTTFPLAILVRFKARAFVTHPISFRADTRIPERIRSSVFRPRRSRNSSACVRPRGMLALPVIPSR